MTVTFRPIKSKHLNVLEIGVGGYDAQLLEARRFVCGKPTPHSQIVGIDLYDKSHLVSVESSQACDRQILRSYFRLSNSTRL